MKNLIFLDLMGTLLEARHVACRADKIYEQKNEYSSRILYVSRKLNLLLKNNIVVINTSVDHCELNDLYLIICDINKYIDINAKDNLHYYISYVENSYNLPELLYTDDKKDIRLVKTKKEIYSEMLERYYELFPIAVDDNILFSDNDGLSMIYRHYGRLLIIHNPMTSTVVNSKKALDYKSRYYPYADNETILVHYIDSYSSANNYRPDEKEKFKQNIYQDYKNGKLDIKDLSFYGIKESTKKYFSKHGFDETIIQDSINNDQITYVSSFEEAYQKVLKYMI